MPSEATRLEHDLLGEKAVPADAYYGVQTARGLENFHISGVQLRLYPDFIKALAMVKSAAARANFECAQFDETILRGIERACQEVIDGKLHDQFLLDVFQGGAGTSTNMNINEVIANRALELMGHRKGEYRYCDPHDHVNASQSTYDAYPTALHIGMALGNRIFVDRVDGWHEEGKGIGVNVNWVRTKFMLIDPLGSKPTTLTGSANFSEASVNTATAPANRLRAPKRSLAQAAVGTNTVIATR